MTAAARGASRPATQGTGRPMGLWRLEWLRLARTPRALSLGAVYVAGARDAAAVRQLGFVPIGGIGAALQMARGQSGPDARIGFLLAPPYFPLRVASGEA